MTDGVSVDIHIGPYDYTNDIRVNLWLSCDVPFTSRYFTKPGVHRYPPESSPCSLYRCSPITDFVRLSRHPHDIVTCVCPDDDGCCHSGRDLRISLHFWRRKIPLSSYLVACQTFR